MDFEKLEKLITDPNKRVASAYHLQQNAPELLRLAMLGAAIEQDYAQWEADADADVADWGTHVWELMQRRSTLT